MSTRDMSTIDYKKKTFKSLLMIGETAAMGNCVRENGPDISKTCQKKKCSLSPPHYAQKELNQGLSHNIVPSLVLKSRGKHGIWTIRGWHHLFILYFRFL